jgi:hypothetical protein
MEAADEIAEARRRDDVLDALASLGGIAVVELREVDAGDD